MSIDLGMFHAAFFDETTEHLAEMEQLLVGLDLDTPNPDALNAIFRAAHSIKGGSGTFGFADMAELTHVLESVLDLLRNGEMQPTREMVDAFLASVDLIQGQLAGHRDGSPVEPEAAAQMAERLEAFLSSPHTPTPPVLQTDAPPALLDEPYRWQLRFSLPEGTAIERGFCALLEDWAQYGMLYVLQRPLHNEGSIVGEWEIHLTTPYTDARIREDLAFFADSSEIQISPLSGLEQDGEASYGFFAPLSSITEASTNAGRALETGFGFFDDAPGAPSPAPEASTERADPGFGFFDDAPSVRTLTEAPNTEGTDPGFGFFDNAPGVPIVAAVSVAKSSAPVVPPVVPYGFFPDAPGAPDTKAPVENQKPTPVTSKILAQKTEGNSIRVSVEKVDHIMNLVGELVIAQSMLAQVASQLDPTWTIRLQSSLDQLARNTRNLQESVMSIRMMPISVVFSRFPRLVRDLAAKLNKQVDLITLGEGTELDKGLTEKLADPLTHLVRNSLDHGIEDPEVRRAKGKDPTGHIILSASHQGGHVVIEIRDDGAGLNRARILAKARERELPLNEGMSDQEVWQIIFAPGFSTAEQITDVSGRGVGMDVVRRNIQEMGGRVDITSVEGLGTTFTVRLPLTLAILDGLSVGVGSEVFILPLGYIIESMRPRAADIRTIAGRGQVVHVRGEYLPILPLADLFGLVPAVRAPEEGILVLLETEGKRIALFVDQLVGQHQVVIKSMESNFRRIDGISGATIMGDGRVALILDVSYLVRRTGRTTG